MYEYNFAFVGEKNMVVYMCMSMLYVRYVLHVSIIVMLTTVRCSQRSSHTGLCLFISQQLRNILLSLYKEPIGLYPLSTLLMCVAFLGTGFTNLTKCRILIISQHFT